MSKYLEKLRHFRKAYKEHGGLVGTYLQWYRTDEVKWGKLVGEDKYGNKYYENKLYFMGRSRWVQFSDSVGMDYDGSQIPADWHRWMHYIGDETPSQADYPKEPWMIDHKENLSGASGQYVPYSTTRPKIEAWEPPKQ